MSYNWGARRYGRVRALEKRCFLAAAAIGAAAVAVVALPLVLVCGAGVAPTL